MKDPHIRAILYKTELSLYESDPRSEIVEEMNLPVAGSRIDMAVINGSLHGFEIKSASDTLKRLPDQIKAYSLVFDYLTVVTEDKYCRKILELIPDWVGVSICSEDSDCECIRIKPARRNEKKHSFYIAKLLWKKELVQLLNKHQVTFSFSDRAWTMCEKAAKEIDIDTLSHSVRELLKKRYSNLQHVAH